MFDQLRDRFPRVYPRHDPPDPIAPDAVLMWERDTRTLAHLLDSYSGVRWVHQRRAGMAPNDLAVLRAHPDVAVTTSRGANGPAIAEYVVATLLALHKQLPVLQASQQQAIWRRGFRIQELRGRTVTILGLGDLGSSVARLLRPFGVRLIGIRRHPEPSPDLDEVHAPAAFFSLLPRTQVLVVAAPLTPETRGLVGKEALESLPLGSYVVNVGRGPIVREDALVEALRSGHLAGAALDVFEEEPLPPSSPLWTAPNLILTPHCSGHTEEVDERAAEIFFSALDDFLAGQPLPFRVDLALGY